MSMKEIAIHTVAVTCRCIRLTKWNETIKMLLMDVNLIQKSIIQMWTFRFSYLWIELCSMRCNDHLVASCFWHGLCCLRSNPMNGLPLFVTYKIELLFAMATAIAIAISDLISKWTPARYMKWITMPMEHRRLCFAAHFPLHQISHRSKGSQLNGMCRFFHIFFFRNQMIVFRFYRLLIAGNCSLIACLRHYYFVYVELNENWSGFLSESIVSVSDVFFSSCFFH